ncbi:DUF952 domain-containing protein [Glycomyces algeriensis]|uniref:Glutathione S-transferase n=1 Tax=Glycomyces algeriensis TaxID=256037 RepID=A0A9W6G5I6_9ACTN|nr:DUF952 domain-containing protein [Glycomyces algeriensis]MDA1368381.1 DUF952 domain-containing protein [Glycomyces algeriensis]MDR7353187.1 uncharacterized protein (DUF952 family) [Glycomyces algeriensis]GLI40881.1 hypothetical protein GALLR39Z86_07310 [Glycomyces algeriensis]
MTELLHLTEPGLWEAALAAGVYEGSTRGRTLAEEGFIHCSLPEQLEAVAALVYGDHPGPLVVLVIDTELVDVPIRYEAPAPGAPEYPHLYGPLPTSAVVEVRPWAAA